MVFLFISRAIICNPADPASFLTNQDESYDPNQAIAWAHRPIDGERVPSLIDHLELKENTLLRISQRSFHNFFIFLEKVISAKRQSGMIYLNRRAFIVRLLLDEGLKQKFDTLILLLGLQPPENMSQQQFDDCVDEFRRRIIIEMEFKMTGELRSKLNNKIKENRLKAKSSKKKNSETPAGASPRTMIAATSNNPSNGIHIR